MADRHERRRARPLLPALIILAALLVPGTLWAQDDRALTFLSSDLLPFGALRDGKPVGFAAEIIEEIMGRLGREDLVEFGEWKDVYERTLNEPYTVLWPPSRTPERENLFKWVGPLVPEKVVFFARKGSGLTISSLEDAKKVGAIATVTGYASEKLLKKEGFTNLVSQRSPLQGPDALKFGRVDLWISSNISMKQSALDANVDPELFEPVFLVKEIPSYLAFSKTVPDEVVNRWQAELDNMKRDGTWERIVSGWIPAELLRIGEDSLDLTDREHLWIEAHPVLKVVHFFHEPPFTVDTEHAHVGYLYDLLSETTRRAGLGIEFVDGFTDYDSMVEALRSGEADILTTMENTRLLPENVVRTVPVVRTPYALVARIGSPEIDETSDLFGARVAVVKGYAQDRHLDSFPRVRKVHVRNNEAGFESVRRGEAEYFLNNLANASYEIKKTFATDLRIAGTLSYVDFPPLALSFGVHGGDSPLPGIIHKALAAVPVHVLGKLREEWLPESAVTNEDWEAIKKSWVTRPAERGSEIRLTREERAFLKDHPVIRVSNEMDYPPFDFARGGEPRGYSIDYLNLLAERLGIRLEYVNGYSWADLLSMFEERELDLIHSAMETEDRLQYTVFTRPYARLLHAMITRKENSDIRTLEDLKGRTLAMQKGYATNDYIRPRYPEIKILWVKNTVEGLKAVSAGQADAVIDAQSVASYLIRKYFLSNLAIANRIEIWEEDEQDLRVGVRSDWPVLKAILEKAMDSVTRREESLLEAKWFGLGETAPAGSEVRLTSEERDFLRRNPVLDVAFDVDWPPVEFADGESEMKGMAADYLARLSGILGVELRPGRSRPWKEMLAAVKEGELDFFSAISPTPQRREWMSFTDSYLSFPIVIITGKEVPYIASMSDLRDKEVAVVDGYASHDLLVHNHPDLTLSPVSEVKEGLMNVSTGKAFAFVGSLATASHVMSREGLADLKVSGETPYSYDLSMGTKSENILLLQILSKALAAVGSQERNAIHSRWTSVTFEHRTDYSMIWRILALSLGVISLVLYWNGRLKKEIGERKEAERGLRESEQRLAETQRIAQLGTWEFNALNEEITWSNETFRIAGRPRKEKLTIEEYLEMVHPDDRPLLEKAMEKATAGQTPYEVELRHRFPDGTYNHTLTRGKPVVREGQVVGFIGSVLDITSRKRAEEEVRRAQEAAVAANRAKSVFLANMSHELRTPLNAVLGFAGILAKSRTLSQDDRKSIDIIRRSGEHLLTLINDVLDLSRIEAGKVGLSEEVFDLHGMLDELKLMFGQKAETKGIRLELHCGSTVPHYVYADQVKLRQVLINLVGNAVKFTERGIVAVRVNARPATGGGEGIEDDLSLLFEVEDTGPGVARGDLERIFSPFAQAGVKSDSHEGTGLGLAISRKFVEVMGGDLEVESEQERATVFRFQVRVRRAACEDPARESIERRVSALAPGQPGYRILIVDDIATNRLLLRKIFERLGFDIREAADGKESMTAWEEWRPHLIWMDMRMPVVDGYEATRRIRESVGEEQPVIIGITASVFDEKKVIGAGCDDFVIKPFREGDVIALVEKHLHVEFVHENDDRKEEPGRLVREDPALSPSDFDALPRETYLKLKRSVATLEMDVALKVIEEIRKEDSPLADSLQELAEKYRFDTLQKLLERR